MGDETISGSLAEAQALAELEAEFQMELERNAAALKLLQERAEEARLAKSRAELSQQKMECMKVKYSQVHDKLQNTKQTLRTAQERIDRQNQLHETVKSLRDRADQWADKLQMTNKQKEECSFLFADGSGFDFPEPLINYAEEEEKERKLQEEQQDKMQQSPQEENKIDYARTVLELQEKLSRVNKSGNDQSSSSSSPSSTSTSSSSSAEMGKKESNSIKKAVDHEEAQAIAIDLNESVQRLEAKCAGVREELGRMALSEQYMRTKQAQLRAKKKELEAKEAMSRAEEREKEAADMRRKVEDMMKLLTLRKSKLKVTENVIVQKGNVVDNVNKIVHHKERRANYVAKQKVEQVMFDKKPSK